MAMKRLSSLMLRKWKDKERWSGRRRSEPFGGREDEDEDEEQRKTDRRARQTHKWMLRRKSEPCGQMEKEEKNEGGQKKGNRKFGTNMEDDDRKDRRRTEIGGRKDRRKSAAWLIVDDKEGGRTDSDMPVGALWPQQEDGEIDWTQERGGGRTGEPRKVRPHWPSGL